MTTLYTKLPLFFFWTKIGLGPSGGAVGGGYPRLAWVGEWCLLAFAKLEGPHLHKPHLAITPNALFCMHTLRAQWMQFMNPVAFPRVWETYASGYSETVYGTGHAGN